MSENTGQAIGSSHLDSSVRPPSSISPAAQATLRALFQHAPPGGSHYPHPSERESWRTFIEQSNAGLLSACPLYTRAELPGIRSRSTTLAGVRIHIAEPEDLPASREKRVYLQLHGGGLVFLEGEGCRREGLLEARRVNARVISVDFRVPPDHPYPAALDDCLAVYRALLEQHRPSDVIVAGVSGGGNLAAALMLRSRDEGLPCPAALVLMTPEVDLTESGDTFTTLLGADPVLTGSLRALSAFYAPDQDLTHPYLSPLFGTFDAEWPPTLLQSGTRDLFLSNTVRMHRALRTAGVDAELHVWEAMPHGGFYGAPEDDEVSTEIKRFVCRIWGDQ